MVVWMFVFACTKWQGPACRWNTCDGAMAQIRSDHPCSALWPKGKRMKHYFDPHATCKGWKGHGQKPTRDGSDGSNVPSWMGPCSPWITSWFPSKTVVSALDPQNIWSEFMLFRCEIPIKSPAYHGEIPVVTGDHQPPGPPSTNGCPRPCCARIGAQAL